MKKTFIISAILLAIVLILLGVYNFAFKIETAEVAQEAPQIVTEKIAEKVPEKKLEKIITISDVSIIGATIDKKTEEIRYYDLTNGIAWKTDSFGKGKKQLSESTISGLKNVLWAPDYNRVLITIKKDGQDIFYEHELQPQKATALKNGLDTAVWDNLGGKIFYKYYDSATKKRTLNIANPDGSDWQKISDIEARDVSIAPVPLTSLVSFWNSPNANEETKLQLASVAGGDAKVIFTGKYGSDYLWAPNGLVAIVSALVSKEGNSMTLGVLSIDGQFKELNIPTMASKCVWSQDSKTIYYALPGGIPDTAIMPNEYQENKFTTMDTFWKANIISNEKSRIIDTSEITGNFDATNMFLSPVEDALYFKNKVDQKLYQLKL